MWVALSSAALALGFVGYWAIGHVLPYPRSLVYSALLAVLPGIALGIAQGVFLRALLPIPRWALVTGVTWPLFFAPLYFALALLHDNIAWGGGLPPLARFAIAEIISLFALPMAVAQSILLRKRFHNTVQWILVSYGGT
jgi:hypothetical protein